MPKKLEFILRGFELTLLGLAAAVALLGFVLAAAGVNFRSLPAGIAAWADILPLLLTYTGLLGLNLLLSARGLRYDQVTLPTVALLLGLGLVLNYRLLGAEGLWRQILRGFFPGWILCVVLIIWPVLVERLRRLAAPISLVGLALPFLTALFGEVDETGVRLSLKLGSLPAIQTSELIKLALIIFLAWYIEREGRRVEGRARPILGFLRLPPLDYFLPGALFTALGSLALVAMSDYGAVIILAFIFIGMLYAGFEPRTFVTVGLLGLAMAFVAGLLLALVWEVPDLIRYRFIAYQNPWSQETLVIDGLPTDVTVSDGPGYQLQQSIYAVIAGGLGGAGLGLGNPGFVPLAHSDFIYAALLEEMGALLGFAVLALFALLLLRMLRIAALLPEGQVFERLLLVGIVIHLFIQVYYMVAGTLNLVPVTGITIPFLSQGGTALALNMVEVGIRTGADAAGQDLM